MAQALANRARHLPPGTDPAKLKDQKAGSVFGRLEIARQITPEQYDAGVYWLDAFLHYCRLMGVPVPAMLSPLASAGEVKGGEGVDPSDEVIAARRDRLGVIEAALMDTPGQYYEAKSALMSVVFMDNHPTPEKLGSLRAALNVIHKRCIMPERRR